VRRDVEPHDYAGVSEAAPNLGVNHRAAGDDDDRRHGRCERGAERGTLLHAESGLAPAFKDGGDALARSLLDLRVTISVGTVHPLRDDTADCRFSRAHHPNQEHMVTHEPSPARRTLRHVTTVVGAVRVVTLRAVKHWPATSTRVRAGGLLTLVNGTDQTLRPRHQ
jgi:hypothetical protein